MWNVLKVDDAVLLLLFIYVCNVIDVGEALIYVTYFNFYFNYLTLIASWFVWTRGLIPIEQFAETELK